MSKLNKAVEVNILGRIYQIIVNEGEEEDIYSSENELKKVLDQYTKSYAYKDDKDLLAMAALQFATKAIFFEKEAQNINKELLKKIKKIDNLFNTDVL